MHTWVARLCPHIVINRFGIVVSDAIENRRENSCAQVVTGSRSVSLCRSASLDVGFRCTEMRDANQPAHSGFLTGRSGGPVFGRETRDQAGIEQGWEGPSRRCVREDVSGPVSWDAVT